MLALGGLKAPGQSDRLLADNSLLAANTGKQAAKEGASAHIPGPGLSCPSGEMNRPERERREARRGRGLMIRANAAGARNNRQRTDERGAEVVSAAANLQVCTPSLLLWVT